MAGESSDGPSEAVTGWLSRWVQQVSGPVAFDAAVHYIDDTIAAELPELASDVELRRDLEASTSGHLRALLVNLGSESIELPSAAYALARTLAHRGFGIEMLLRLYRVGLRATHRYLADAVERSADDPELKSEVLVHLWSASSEWLDSAVDVLGPVIVEERRKWLGGMSARRSELVASILHGDSVDVVNANEVLGYSLNRVQTAMTLWVEDVPKAAERLSEIADALAAILGAGEPLAVSSGERGLWVWCATDREPDPGLISTSIALRAATGVRVAVGMSAMGLDGFRRSHRQAEAAARLAILAGHARQVSSYAEVELVTMLSADVEAMKDFVCRELGPLVGDDPATERLRETALAVLVWGIAGAAKVIPVHKNTVRYRLNQIEALLKHPIDQRRAPVELALRCVAEFGARAFP
ncbi:helix-turn-helix domain-containing protein [Rhodococcus sp. IEGM 1379]|uniref:PucR family transcriptional regulator n=1 Tax=Rhodococcus sp. IEGM 1379 TaxID=3047086 RepID=UPI0024B82345|nr:helix-turn-helix domain-containing protein [Rhodococcus sp. IEGM 1379]MDI9916556.1 helix-turn-helix domain-containing protein [Rhodococcus sp. IEGM 1379]